MTAGGFIAHRGLVDPVAAAGAAFAGSFLADQAVFLLGRHQRERAWVRRMRGRRGVTRAVSFIERHPTGFCFAFRFIYGLRVAGPLAIGLSQIPAGRFVLLNAISALLWAGIFTFVGYRFGHAFETAVQAILSSPYAIGAAAALLAAAGWVLWRRHRTAAPPAATPGRS